MLQLEEQPGSILRILLILAFCSAAQPFPAWASPQSPSSPSAKDADRGIQEKLAQPPLFLDEHHQGPTMVPIGLPTGIFPFDCRAVEAYLHRVRPGEYHFQRAQRLLGQGIDVIGCEAFGLERFRSDDQLLTLEQAIREAEAAAAIPIGLEQWRPEALHSVLQAAYSEAASTFAEYGKKRNSAELVQRSRYYRTKAERFSIEQPDVLHTDRGPLMEAVLKGDKDTVAALISRGADVNAIDIDHTSALRLAVVLGQSDVVRLLLTNGGAPDDADEEGVTALMDACSTGNFEIAKALILAHANVNAVANDGSSPLIDVVSHMAFGPARASRRDLASFIIENGAQVNVSDWFGITPLMIAAKSNDADLTQLLLNHNVHLDAIDRDGNSSLIHAVKSDSVMVATILIHRGANLALFNKRDETALILSAKNGYPEGQELTRALVAAGANPNQTGPAGWTPLMSAEAFNYKEPWGVSSHVITSELLERHADVNAHTRNGTTALLAAAGHVGRDDDSFMAELLQAGAHVNVADEDGETPLMAAAELGHVNKVRLLLVHGATPGTRDKLGRTALDYARPPRNKNDDDFPQCYDSIDSSRRKTNDCKATRSILRAAMRQK